MYRTGLVLSRSAFSLWITAIVTYWGVLIIYAPNVPHYAPFNGISLQIPGHSRIHLPNRAFTCVETAEEFQCKTEIQTRSLNLNLTKGEDYRYNLTDCRALYNQQPVRCYEVGINYAPILADLYEIADLDLSPEQFQQVRQQYWVATTLVELGEVGLDRLSLRLSLLGGVCAALFAWFHPGKFHRLFASLTWGIGVVVASLVLCWLVLLALGYAD